MVRLILFKYFSEYIFMLYKYKSRNFADDGTLIIRLNSGIFGVSTSFSKSRLAKIVELQKSFEMISLTDSLGTEYRKFTY